MKNLTKLEVGDTVMTECFSGLGTGGKATVKALTNKYDKNSGEPFPVVILDNDQEFDATTGNAITAPYAYYISHKV
jgi:hypothetical protein